MKTTSQKQGDLDQEHSSVRENNPGFPQKVAKAAGNCLHVPSRISAGRTECGSRLARALQLKLVESGWGRIALHVLVAVKTGHYLWHLQGIARELVRQ